MSPPWPPISPHCTLVSDPLPEAVSLCVFHQMGTEEPQPSGSQIGGVAVARVSSTVASGAQSGKRQIWILPAGLPRGLFPPLPFLSLAETGGLREVYFCLL